MSRSPVGRRSLAAARARLERHYGDDLETFHRAGFVFVIACVLAALLAILTAIFLISQGLAYDAATAAIVACGAVVMGTLMVAAAVDVLRGRYARARWIVATTMAGGVSLAIIFFGSVVGSPALPTLVVPLVVAYCTMPRGEALCVAVFMLVAPALVHLTCALLGIAVPDYTSQASPEVNYIASAFSAIVIAAVCMASQARTNETLVRALTREKSRYADLADRDPLTGLANRRAFERVLESATETAAEAPFALLFIDLDDFKPINDTHGHDVGDLVLRLTAQRLQAGLRRDDLLTRFGGDEFAAIVRTGNADEIAGLVRRLESIITQPIAAGAVNVAVGASIGWTISADAGAKAGDVLAQADAAMYELKQARKARSNETASQDRPPAGPRLLVTTEPEAAVA